ncbi:MAG: ERF family protein [Lachnospiraceae bacterium]|nr:ERF family protein [Lachnospiraceae bacterium]
MNIYEKMSAITREIADVAKNLEVEINERTKYKAVGEYDVLKAVKPIEHKYGVYSFPAHREIVESGEIVNSTKYGEKRSLFVRIEVIYRFVNVEKPEEYVEVFSYGDGVDSQDKASGKAMTYADKYALLKAYKIQTGEDPDAEGSNELLEKNLSKDLASDSEKATFRALCGKAGVDPHDVLKAIGWKGGLMTKAQHGQALAWLKERGMI